ncbi:MAG: hypothetical protein HFJ52_06620 [Clostridia bacterium]|nr:hypothetical protein [Clostridia bacterium]
MNKVSVTISKEKQAENTINIEIDKIEIGNITEIEEGENTKVAKEIKQMISENYGIDKQNISVNSK